MGAKIVRAQEWVGRALEQAKSPLYRNAFYLMASNVVSAGLGGGFTIALTRLYPNSTTDVGYAVLLFSAVSFLAVLSSFGMSVGVTRFLPETEDKISFVNSCLSIVGITAVVLALVFTLGINLWLPGLGFILASPTYPIYIIVIAVATVAIALAPIVDQAGIAMRRADLQFWRVTTMSVLKLVFILLFASILATRGRLGIFLAMAVPFGIAVTVEILLLLPKAVPGYRPRPTLRSGPVRSMLPFSLGNYTASVAGSAGNLLVPAIILTVIGGSAGAAQVAFYYFAITIAGLLSIVPNATFTSFYAEASQKNANRHADERRAILFALALLIPSIALLWFFAPVVLNLLISTYAAGALVPFHILVISVIPTFLNAILGTRVLIRKRSFPIIVSAIIGTVVTLVLGAVLLRSNGLEGLAVAIVIGDFAPTPYLYAVARRPFKGEEELPLVPVPP